MSILAIPSMAFIARADFSASLLCKSSPRIEGKICQDRPNLSVSQPHRFVCPPAESFSHSSSTSSCVSQLTNNEMAGEKVNWGPPLSAKNCCPSSWKVTDITDPFGPGPASPYLPTLTTFEFLKTET